MFAFYTHPAARIAPAEPGPVQMIKPFLEQKTRRKVKFVYTEDPATTKIIEDAFGMDKLESAFGAGGQLSFDYDEFSNRMREDDKRIPSFWARKEEARGGGLRQGQREAAEPPPAAAPGSSESESDDSSGGNGVDSSPPRPPSGDDSADEGPQRASA